VRKARQAESSASWSRADRLWAGRCLHLFEHQAVAHDDRTVGVAGELDLVGDHDDGLAGIVEPAQQLHHLAARVGVEGARRLVGQQQRRPIDDRPGEGHALLLAAGELSGLVMPAFVEPDSGQGFAGASASLGRFHAGIDQGKLDVLLGGVARQQMGVLEDEADFVSPQQGPFVRRHGRAVALAEQAMPARRQVQQAEEAEQGRLARARPAKDDNELPRVDRQVDVLQSGHACRLRSVSSREAGRAEERPGLGRADLLGGARFAHRSRQQVQGRGRNHGAGCQRCDSCCPAAPSSVVAMRTSAVMPGSKARSALSVTMTMV
jgi:hypothetical protein